MLVLQRDGVGEEDLLDVGIVEALDGIAGEHAVRRDQEHLVGALLFDDPRRVDDGTTGGAHVVNEHAVGDSAVPFDGGGVSFGDGSDGLISGGLTVPPTLGASVGAVASCVCGGVASGAPLVDWSGLFTTIESYICPDSLRDPQDAYYTPTRTRRSGVRGSGVRGERGRGV